MLLLKIDQQFTKIRFHILAIWWVEPHKHCFCFLSVLSIAIIKRHWWKWSLYFRGCLIDRFSLVKLFLITGKIRNSFADRFRKLFDDCRRMFRKCVDIQWRIVTLWKEKYFFFCWRLKVISRKCVLLKFVSMMVESHSSLNNTIASFLILSRFRPFTLFIAASPLSLYKPTLLLWLTVLIIDSS